MYITHMEVSINGDISKKPIRLYKIISLANFGVVPLTSHQVYSYVLDKMSQPRFIRKRD